MLYLSIYHRRAFQLLGVEAHLFCILLSTGLALHTLALLLLMVSVDGSILCPDEVSPETNAVMSCDIFAASPSIDSI